MASTYIHSACGMPWREHNFVGNEAICPDEPRYIAPWKPEEEEPEPPIASLFDPYEE